MSTIDEIIRKNMGSRERMIRISAGLIIMGVGLFYFGGKNGQILGVTLTLMGVLPVLTGLLNLCPLYSVMGLKIKKNKRN
jgi:hypothetical protein